MSDPLDLGEERFISLTTFRRVGTPVPTPVWVVRDGDTLLVTTPEGSGKVKRLRHTPRVEMRPCTRTGKVADDAPVSVGVVEILPEDRPEVFRAKYGLEYRVFMLAERVVRRGQEPRVLLRITPN